jgi:hypothetical protein
MPVAMAKIVAVRISARYSERRTGASRLRRAVNSRSITLHQLGDALDEQQQADQRDRAARPRSPCRRCRSTTASIRPLVREQLGDALPDHEADLADVGVALYRDQSQRCAPRSRC